MESPQKLKSVFESKVQLNMSPKFAWRALITVFNLQTTCAILILGLQLLVALGTGPFSIGP